jgi:hypothetical protein
MEDQGPCSWPLFLHQLPDPALALLLCFYPVVFLDLLGRLVVEPGLFHELLDDLEGWGWTSIQGTKRIPLPPSMLSR